MYIPYQPWSQMLVKELNGEPSDRVWQVFPPGGTWSWNVDPLVFESVGSPAGV
jgi:hypothetical protein